MEVVQPTQAEIQNLIRLAYQAGQKDGIKLGRTQGFDEYHHGLYGLKNHLGADSAEGRIAALEAENKALQKRADEADERWMIADEYYRGLFATKEQFKAENETLQAENSRLKAALVRSEQELKTAKADQDVTGSLDNLIKVFTYATEGNPIAQSVGQDPFEVMNATAAFEGKIKSGKNKQSNKKN